MAPIAKVVATDEPETAAKIMHTITQVMGRPPRTSARMLSTRSTRRDEMPPAAMMLPARMKKGMAASGNLSRAMKACWGTTMRGRPVNSVPMTPDRPMATATGTAISISPTMAMIMAASMAGSLKRGAGGGRVRVRLLGGRVDDVGDEGQDRQGGTGRQRGVDV